MCRAFRILCFLSVVLGNGLNGCETGKAVYKSGKVAIIPFDSMGVDKSDVTAVEGALKHCIKERVTSAIASPSQVKAAMKEISTCSQPGKVSQPECAISSGHRVHADYTLAGAIGGLGNTYILQLKLFKVKKNALTRSLEETFFGRGAAMTQAVGPIVERLFDLPPKQPPWYKRWWPWALVGTAVAAAVIIPLTLQESDPYETIDLP